jgi:glycine hydroxymethyltransferase
MADSNLAGGQSLSLQRQERLMRTSLILNPVENVPFLEDLGPASGPLHGLYHTDKLRSAAQQRATDHQFSGRRRLAYHMRRVYRAWADALQASDLTMRLLSGLHAHTVVFMAMTRPGQRVLLLPEVAGGHMSTKSILERLSLQVVEMAIDADDLGVDISRTIDIATAAQVDFVFVDRSEGLVYEDFSEVVSAAGKPAVFDAPQYLSNIVAGDFPNPFSMGIGLDLPDRR